MLSPEARQVLKDLMESGQSEAVGVADILDMIATNSTPDEPKMAEDAWMIMAAKEIIDSAQTVIDRLHAAKGVSP